MTALTHTELGLEIDIGVVPRAIGSSLEGAAIGALARRYYGPGADWSPGRIDGGSPGESVVRLLNDLVRREVAFVGPGPNGEPSVDLAGFLHYVVAAPVVPVENSWPIMTSLWALVSAVGGGASAGASLGLIFTPVGAVVGAIVGAGSAVLVGASKGAGDAAGERLGRRILRAGEGTDLRSRLDEIDRLLAEGRITPAQASTAKEVALRSFAGG